MSKLYLLNRAGVYLLTGLLLLTMGLVTTIMLSPNPNQNQDFSGGSFTSLSPRNPGIRPGDGIQNDLQSEFGPWWITKELSWLTIDNPSFASKVIDFDITINLGICSTERTVIVTSMNQSSEHRITKSRSSVMKRFSVAVPPQGSTNLIFQVAGAACQAPNDPRIFFGQVLVSKWKTAES